MGDIDGKPELQEAYELGKSIKYRQLNDKGRSAGRVPDRDCCMVRKQAAAQRQKRVQKTL